MINMELDKKRISYIDIAKGLGMFLVIWGHIRGTGISNAMVYAFHMPLFFFLSGMTFNRHKYSSIIELIKKRIKTLIIPYVIFSILTWLFWVAYNMILGNSVESYWMPLLQTAIAQGSGGYLVHNSTLWFATCLFSVEMIYYFISKLNSKWNVLICVACAIAGNFCIMEGSPLRYLPWSIDMALCAVPFYMLGNMLIEYYGHEKLCNLVNKKKLVSVVFIAAALVVLYFGAKLNGPVSMGHRKFNMVYVFYPLAFVGIAMHLSLSILLANAKNRAVAFIRWFGNYSFNVMAVQTPIKGVVLVMLSKLIHKSVGELSDNTVYSLIAFGITLIVVTVVVKTINRIAEIIKGKLVKP